ALEHKTCHENWAHPTLPLADAKDAFLPKETRVKLMTWNACSLSFPLRIHPAKLLLGIFLGFWWHDPQRDVPLQVRSRAARERCQRQAEYIRQSGADLIMLQEMLSTTMLETLMCHLASDFDCAYLTCRPTLSAVLLWTLFLLTVAFWQCALLQICLMVWSTSALGFCERWLMLAIWLALRSRGAVPFHFLCGDVAGQLVVLRRQTSRLEACVAKEFQAFDALGHQLLARSWLCVFFNVRPRGILRVTVPLGPRMGSLTLLNTHLPHNSDNSKLLRSVSSYASSFACHGPVVLAGDFNPQPHIELQQQLKPLLAAGLVPTDGLEEQHCTWDLQQPLTRRNPGTPRTMQLDFIFLRPWAFAFDLWHRPFALSSSSFCTVWSFVSWLNDRRLARQGITKDIIVVRMCDCSCEQASASVAVCCVLLALTEQLRLDCSAMKVILVELKWVCCRVSWRQAVVWKVVRVPCYLNNSQLSARRQKYCSRKGNCDGSQRLACRLSPCRGRTTRFVRVRTPLLAGAC
ncbi:unnamed protein product, partial [Effrenium voratum]